MRGTQGPFVARQTATIFRNPAVERAAGRHLSADLFIGRPHGGALVPAAVQLCVHFTRAILFPSSRTSETPPQSGSGRKKHARSKAAESAAVPRRCTYIRLLNGNLTAAVRGSRGDGPLRVFSPLFRAKKRCRRRLMPSDLTAERQRPQGADQIESRKKRGCAAPMHSHTVAES